MDIVDDNDDVQAIDLFETFQRESNLPNDQ